MDSTRTRLKVAVDTLGCKVNQAETEALVRSLAQAGYDISSPDDCDVYVLNTCAVTHVADRKSRHLLRLARRRNPRAVVVATGCYADSAPQELSDLGVDLVAGNRDKQDLPRLLQESGRIKPGGLFPSSGTNGTRTRAFVKVQDGCNSFCSYCIVPLVRGRERSVPVDEVVAGVRDLVASGYKEIVLTGVKAGAYRSNGTGLRELLEKVLSETRVARLRISSLQPQEVSADFLGLWRDSRLCRHFHLSIQSGSDSVLSGMKRAYSAADYIRAVGEVRSAVPGAAITTDVIVGFPGETESEFRESYDTCRDIGFARIHVFPFSARKGTLASRLPGQVPQAVKKERTVKMLDLATESARVFHRGFAGQVMSVLWERRENGAWSGLTDNYIRVYAVSREDLTNRLTSAHLLAVDGDGMRGTVVA